MFLHADIIHIMCNMYALYVVGPRVEDFFGKRKYLLIYFLSGLSGSLLSVGLNSDVASVGASGAIFGLFGALLYFGYSYRGYVGAMVKSQILPVVFLNSNMLGTIENKKYEVSNICLFIIYFVFLIYLGIFR